ncbi:MULTISPECIES: Acg family FMN-binding oxidoreductase [Salinibaculum]|uniref:Acg family FMN-binding oxidoreductase n=1 Tax=Salinibaculum TaxID=2732368 RepID=UPI0030CCCD10
MDAAELTRDVWDLDPDAFPADASLERQVTFLLRYAILAPSSHNSQPWRFAVDGGTVAVRIADDRRLEVADPDGRELHLSVGCAVENLCVAAEHFGFAPDVDDDPDGGAAAVVSLHPDAEADSPRPPELFDALTARYTSHRLFEDRPIPDTTLGRFRQCAVEDDVTLHLVSDAETKESVAELQAAADEALMDDPDYRRELGYWVGTGALGASWLAARLGQTVVTHFDLGAREGRKNSKFVQRAPLVAVLSTPTDDPTTQVRAGQVFERLALVATTADLAVHPLSQTLERPDARADLADRVGIGDGVPQHLFRVGYADETPEHTPRLPLEAVLEDAP